MSHLHIVHDSDAHFVIDPITRAIKNESGKVTVIQHDHNSERFTFSIQKQVDGHDMSACNRVEIHYINIDATDKTQKATGVYEADDLKTSSDDGGKVTFSWLLSRNATQYAGSLNFLIRFACITDGVEEYAWHTSIFQSITVGSGMYNGGEEVIEPYLDVIAQWKNDLFGVGDTQEQRLLTVSAEQQAAIAAKGAAVLDSIPDEYEALQTGVDTLFNSVASGIRGNLSGSVVRADDVSAVEHNPIIKIYGKNMFNINALEVMPANYTVRISAIDVENNSFTITTAESHDGNGYCGLTNANGNYAPTLRDLCPQLEVGKTYVLSGKTDSRSTFIYLRDVSRSWVFGKPLTITEECLNAKIAMYGLDFAGGEGTGDCTITNIQVEEGTIATEYTPYIDPATVTVKRCGKNLANGATTQTITSKGIKISRTEGSSELIIDGTAEGITSAIAMKTVLLPPGTYTASVYGLNTNSENEDRAYVWDQENEKVLVNYIMTNAPKTFTITEPRYARIEIVFGAATSYSNKKVLLQLEAGETATDYEPHKAVTNHITAADGTVDGVTSVSPTMTIMTDTEGVTVECEYIVDTKTYIDNEIAKALKGSEQA